MKLYELTARTVGKNVRYLRTKRGLSLPALAAKAKVSKSIVSKLENGKLLNPSLRTLLCLAWALDTGLKQLTDVFLKPRKDADK